MEFPRVRSLAVAVGLRLYLLFSILAVDKVLTGFGDLALSDSETLIPFELRIPKDIQHHNAEK